MTRQTLLLLIVLIVAPAPARAATVIPPGSVHYDILRDGTRIGSHILGVRRVGNTMLVDINIEVHVYLLFIKVYEYRKTVREIWKRDRLVAYDARIDDNGSEFQVKAHTTPAGLVVRGPKGTMTAPPGSLMTGYWNIETVRRTRLIDGEENKFLDITVEFAGEHDLTIDGHIHRTRLFRLRGSMERDIWYDHTGRMVQMRAVVRDGSVVITRRR